MPKAANFTVKRKPASASIRTTSAADGTCYRVDEVAPATTGWLRGWALRSYNTGCCSGPWCDTGNCSIPGREDLSCHFRPNASAAALSARTGRIGQPLQAQFEPFRKKDTFAARSHNGHGHFDG